MSSGASLLCGGLSSHGMSPPTSVLGVAMVPSFLKFASVCSAESTVTQRSVWTHEKSRWDFRSEV